MLGCKMGATPFLEIRGGSGYTRLDKINVGKAVEYIVSCRNLDGGFWYIAVFCCVAALAIAGPLQHVDKGLLGWWLCEGQVKSGDLNGRPDKLPDAGLLLLDMEDGGISDRPDDAIDVFHTYFGVAGLSLLEYPGLKPIDPAYALPADVVNRIFFGKR